jgi:hypothetical protein
MTNSEEILDIGIFSKGTDPFFGEGYVSDERMISTPPGLGQSFELPRFFVRDLGEKGVILFDQPHGRWTTIKKATELVGVIKTINHITLLEQSIGW